MPEQMPKVYEGNLPYIFVCYAHADRDAVLPIIRALDDEGYRVWYDDGIELATDYPRKVADHVYGCAFFVMFVSWASLGSKWCGDEANYALDLGKRVLPVYLEEVELTRDLQMRMGRTQSIFWHKISDDTFYGRLFGVRLLDCCLTDEGRRRRGVKARGDKADADLSRPVRPLRIVTDKLSGVSGVIKIDKLADYSWAELKELSRMIAAAGSDEDGLAIARDYGLVDKDGKLQGDEKPFELKSGTKTSVRILGFRHDELVDGGKAGISFEFADVPVWHRMNTKPTNLGGWEKCEMRGWLKSSFLGLLPDELSESIVEVRKRTNNCGEAEHDDETSVVTVTPDRLWLLSVYEVYGGVPSWMHSPAIYAAEGAQYQLYADRGATSTDYDFCAKKGANSWWWIRSPRSYDSFGFRYVRRDGGWDWDNADIAWGVSPGFCF